MMLLAAASAGRAGDAAKPPRLPAHQVILGTRGLWRVRVVWETDETMLEDGTVGHFRFHATKGGYQAWRKRPTFEDYEAKKVPCVRLPAETSRDWMKPDFDDSRWARCRGRLFAGDPKGRKGGWGSENHHWALLLLRGRFEVPDPVRANGLRLWLTYRGGVVVYLNGEELTRSDMPGGEVRPTTNAEPYPEEVYLLETGHLISSFDHRIEGTTERMRRRWRRIDGVEVPADRLRKGVNVLAVAIHRPPAHWKYYTTRVRPYAYGVYDKRASARWSRVALWDVRLTAPPRAVVVPNVAQPAGRPFLAWNHSVISRVRTADYADPHEPLRPVRIKAVRNGIFAGQVVVGGDRAMTGLVAVASDLTGPGRLPAERVEVLYGRCDGKTRVWRSRIASWFDSLDEVPAERVEVSESGSAVQPVWVRVHVPEDAKPGTYKGRLTVRAKVGEPIVVPIELEVIDWTLKDSTDYTGYIDVFQSPGSLAIEYGVPMWSEKHWALIDRSFRLLGELGCKTVYIPCVRRTHLGNEHSMVRWVRKDGKLVPDTDIAERYLDTAVEHLGRMPGVILYCWEPPTSMGHAGSGPSRTHDRKILITVVDPETGKLEKAEGPKWGTPECRAFWRRFTDQMGTLLKKRGLFDSMLFGLLGDHRATKRAMNEITNGVPKGRARWALHSHNYCDTWLGHEIGMCVALWGVKCYPVEPERGHGYGWRNPFWLSYYPREMKPTSPLVDYRVQVEKRLGSTPWNTSRWPKSQGVRGIGRLGAEFWRVLKDRRGNRRSTLAARYPETYWGQLCLNYGVPYIFGIGRRGAVPTVRSEAFRENMQEIEARVFLERTLLDKAKRARLGEDLARRCRAALDLRIRAGIRAAGEGWVWFVSSDWEQRTEHLFRLAVEVDRALRAP
jgi:hypothetical protein